MDSQKIIVRLFCVFCALCTVFDQLHCDPIANLIVEVFLRKKSHGLGGALIVAKQELAENVLPRFNITFKYKYLDGCNRLDVSKNFMPRAEDIQGGEILAGFILDECEKICQDVGVYGAALGIPVVSFGCKSIFLDPVNGFTTFSRSLSNGRNLGKVVDALMVAFKWKRLVYLIPENDDVDYLLFTRDGKDYAFKMNTTAVQAPSGTNSKLTWTEMVAKNKDKTRIFLLFFPDNDAAIVHFLAAANEQDLYNGEYAFIVTNFLPVSKTAFYGALATTNISRLLKTKAENVMKDLYFLQDGLMTLDQRGDNKDYMLLMYAYDSVIIWGHGIRLAAESMGFSRDAMYGNLNKSIYSSEFFYRLDRFEDGFNGTVLMDRNYGDRITDYDVGMIRNGDVKIITRYNRLEDKMGLINLTGIVWPGRHAKPPAGHPMPCGWNNELCDYNMIILGSVIAGILLITVIVTDSLNLYDRSPALPPTPSEAVSVEMHAFHLGDLVKKRTSQIETERERASQLLYSLLPEVVADALKQGKTTSPESYASVSIYFSDIVGFTKLAAASTPLQIVELLGELYSKLDSIFDRHDTCNKVETIGDAYMVSSGLPIQNGTKHAIEIATVALKALNASASFTFKIAHLPEKPLQIRIEVHTGPVVSGVVGVKMPRYCLFRETVAIAFKMESNSVANQINISQATASILENTGDFLLHVRGDYDTQLQELPIELLMRILVKAVAMEVKAMKLAKSVWKQKADLVISRLRTVSFQWNNILTTNYFRNELHRTLDGHAQETIRWEILIQPSIQSYIWRLTSMRDEVFMLCGQYGSHDYALNVCDRNNVVEPKDVIPLSEFHLGDMAACSVSNCVYLLNADTRGPSVIRITKDEHQFKTSLWIKNLRLPSYDMGPISVSANGSLIILSKQRSTEPTAVVIYDANGFMQQKINMPQENYRLSDLVPHSSIVIQKSNGNILLVCSSNRYETKLSEIDLSGRIIREYQSSYIGAGVKSFEDIYGRILVKYWGGRMELLDSEFNLMDVAVPQLADGQVFSPRGLHYNSERHEMVGLRYDSGTVTSALVTFRFTEE